MKNGLPGAGQDKDTMTAVQRVSNKVSAIMTSLKGQQLLKVHNMVLIMVMIFFIEHTVKKWQG